MKRIATVLLVLMLGGFLLAGNAMALNYRPVTPGYSSETSLQDLLDGYTTNDSYIDVVADQTSHAYFNNAAGGGSTATFILAIAGNASTNTFGMYEQGNIDNKIEIFSGGADSGQRIFIDFHENGTINVGTLESGILDSGLFSSSFGFYLGYNVGGQAAQSYFYTDDLLNPGQNPQALVYQGNDATMLAVPNRPPGLFTSNHFLFAWEDIAYANADRDFNDMVILMESIAPVPEPATMLLLGVGILGMGVIGRKKLSKR